MRLKEFGIKFNPVPTDGLRPLAFTRDLDGIHFFGPFGIPLVAVKTELRFRQGTLKLPEQGQPLIPRDVHTRGIAEVFSSIDRWQHQIRKADPEAFDNLLALQKIASESGRRHISVVLSGRDPSKHEMTVRKLIEVGQHYAFDYICLNQATHGSEWKSASVAGLLEAGFNVVDMEDDLKASLLKVREGEDRAGKVLGYLKRGSMDREALRRKLAVCGIELPDNLVLISSYKIAEVDLRQRLEDGRI